MKHPLHLLIPMSGQGVRFQAAGFTMPKPLIPISGTPMIERLLTCFPEHWKTHFVTAANHESSGLEKKLRELRPTSTISAIAPHKKGPSYAILEGLKQIPEEAPVLVSYCDYSMIWDPMQFERFVGETECDACVISYRGFHAHYLHPQTYAFSRMEGERVVEVREKGSFTDNREKEYASSGGYYFRTAKLLKEAIEHQMSSGLELSGEYYTSLTVEALLRKDPSAHVRVFEIPAFFQWGRPEDVREFEYWEKAYRKGNLQAGKRGKVAQVLIPMAGLGSRFATTFSAPKPFLKIGGTPMFQLALETLPQAEKVGLVTVEKAKPFFPAQLPSHYQTRFLKETPPGQAFSTEEGLSLLDPTREVLVSACDHGIVLDNSSWERFHAAPECDAAIFTMQGYTGALRKPLSYSYVVPEGDGEFPRVTRVSVKKPTRENPLEDHVLVGTFWFRTASLLKEGILELKKRDVRVNGELYLDSVFDCMKALGLSVRMIPLDGYLCWGDPESLAETLYWQEVFGGRKLSVRERFSGVTQ
jgi:NDP-sugar pyrophosphorylase family protein